MNLSAHLAYYTKQVARLAGRMPKQRLIIILSLVIGVLSGFSAVLLKNMVYTMRKLMRSSVDATSVSILYFAIPFAGLVLTYLFVQVFLKEKKLQGITRILYAISKKGGRLKKQDTVSPLIASTLTVGSGGSVGLESPIVLSGSAIGSNIGQLLGLDYKTITLLIGCGAAGATASIFSAPVAALLFALEVLMIDLTVWSIVPLLISAITGTTISWLFLKQGAVYGFTVMDPLVINNMPYYALLGLLTGLISVYFARMTKKVEGWMDSIGRITYRYSKKKRRFVRGIVKSERLGSMRKLLIGGSILGLLIFLFPVLYGEGYEGLNIILTGNAHELLKSSFFYNIDENVYLIMLFLTLVMVFKVIAMAVTTGSGGVGGIFAPSLFMGGLSGYVISLGFNKLSFVSVSSKNFVMAGMAGVMAGVMHAPLTSIFLIVETTGGHGLFLPIGITAAFSFIASKYLEPNTIYTDRLAKRGELITHNKDKAILTLLKTNDLIETDFTVLHANQTLGDLVALFPESKRNSYAVVGDSNHFLGIVNLDDIRSILFKPELYGAVTVGSLMVPATVVIETNMRMDRVMDIFERTGAWNLPVTEQGRYVGFLSSSKIFSAYRTTLQDFYE